MTTPTPCAGRRARPKPKASCGEDPADPTTPWPLPARPDPARHRPDGRPRREAEAQTRESLRLSPHNPLASAQLGQILLDAGRTNEAVALFEEPALAPLMTRSCCWCLAAPIARGARPGPPPLLRRGRGRSSPTRTGRIRGRSGAGRPTLDIGLHRRLAGVYARLGRPDKARQETDTVRLLLKECRRRPASSTPCPRTRRRQKALSP